MTLRTKTFTSPINVDDGVRHHFVGHAACRMVLATGRPSAGYGECDAHIKWVYRFLDGDHVGLIEQRTILLWFNNKRLVHFDGVFELPEQAIELLEENGYNAEYARTV